MAVPGTPGSVWGEPAILAHLRPDRLLYRPSSRQLRRQAIEARIENGEVHLVLPKKETHRRKAA
jgi:hypothetical protein